MCVCVCACAHAQGVLHAYKHVIWTHANTQRPLTLCLIVLRQRLSQNWTLKVLVRLAGQWAPGIRLLHIWNSGVTGTACIVFSSVWRISALRVSCSLYYVNAKWEMRAQSEENQGCTKEGQGEPACLIFCWLQVELFLKPTSTLRYSHSSPFPVAPSTYISQLEFSHCSFPLQVIETLIKAAQST